MTEVTGVLPQTPLKSAEVRAFDAPSLGRWRGARKLPVALALVVIGAALGWPLGAGAARATVIEGGPIEVLGHQSSAVTGALTALCYGVLAPWLAPPAALPWLGRVGQLVVAPVLLTALVAGSIGAVLGLGIASPLGFLVSVSLLLAPLPSLFVPAVVFAPLCAFVCRVFPRWAGGRGASGQA